MANDLYQKTNWIPIFYRSKKHISERYIITITIMEVDCLQWFFYVNLSSKRRRLGMKKLSPLLYYGSPTYV